MRLLHLVCTSILILFFSSQFLQAAELPLDKQVEFFLKVLKFDRTVMGRSGTSLRVGVVYAANGGTPTELLTQIDDIFYEKSVAGEKIGEKALSHSLLSFSSRANFEQQLKMFEISAFFILPGNDANIADLSNVAKTIGVITFTGVPKYVSEGIAVGVKDVDGKPKVIVNLPLAKEQGADLNANLLKMADIIK